MSALEQLARQADASGDFNGVLRWRHRAVDADPLDGSAVVALARVLARRGDRSAAIRALREHEEKVRKNLEVEPDSEVLRLIGELSA